MYDSIQKISILSLL